MESVIPCEPNGSRDSLLSPTDSQQAVDYRDFCCTPEGTKFMQRYASRILKYGFREVTTKSKWVVVPVLVEKPPTAHFRLIFDCRPINAVSPPRTWPVPHIDSELSDLTDSKFFANIDFVSGY